MKINFQTPLPVYIKSGKILVDISRHYDSDVTSDYKTVYSISDGRKYQISNYGSKIDPSKIDIKLEFPNYNNSDLNKSLPLNNIVMLENGDIGIIRGVDGENIFFSISGTSAFKINEIKYKLLWADSKEKPYDKVKTLSEVNEGDLFASDNNLYLKIKDSSIKIKVLKISSLLKPKLDFRLLEQNKLRKVVAINKKIISFTVKE